MAALAWCFLILEVFYPGIFCQRLCPTGAFLRLISRLRILKLTHEPKAGCLKGCNLCNDACWLHLNPRTRSENPDCDSCQRCTVKCPTTRLRPALFVLVLAITCIPTLKAQGLSPLSQKKILWEQEIAIRDSPVTTRAFYSFLGDHKIEREQNLSLVIHLPLKKSFFSDPMKILLHAPWFPQKRVHELRAPNFPGSIGESTGYRIDFPYQIGRAHV